MGESVTDEKYLQPQVGPYDIVARATSFVFQELTEQAPDRGIGFHVSMVTIQDADGQLAPALSIHLIGDGLEVGKKVMTTLTLSDLCPPPEAFTDVVRQGLEHMAESLVRPGSVAVG